VSGIDQTGDLVVETEVDLDSARHHVRAVEELRARGVAMTEETYLQALSAAGYDAQTEPPESVTEGEPALVHHRDPSIHAAALMVAHEAGMIRNSDGILDQQSYDGAVQEALRRRGGRS
jgi:hypothetical protein